MDLTLNPGDRILRYRIVAPLGAGGMGEVYRAHDESLDRDVALKILPPALLQNEERVRRFILEAKAASSLNHPHIITIHEIGQLRDVHFIAMELVQGNTLWDRMHREKATLREILGWLAQSAEGVAKAHAAGIVHRDLKPGNIMVSRDGYAKVVDFGLAKLTETPARDSAMTSAPTESERTGDGVVLGTIGYMSPEQVQGKTVDQRSDVFSFGCILYEAATGRRPFAADTSVDTMHRILHDKPAPVEELNPDAPAELRRLIRRCLAKDPNQRLDSMKALALELHEMVLEYDTLTRSGSSGSGASAIGSQTPSRRRQLVIALALGAMVIATTAAGISLWFSRRDQDPRPARAFQSMRMVPATNRGDVTASCLSPDGRYLAYTSGPSGRHTLRMRQLATDTEVPILGPQKEAPADLKFSPDGAHLYYQTSPALYRISTLGGMPRKWTINAVSPVSISPDGGSIAFLRGVPGKTGTSLILLDLESGRERELSHVRSPLFGHPVAWSPDGERIATTEGVDLGADGLPFARLVTFDVKDATRHPIGMERWWHIGSLSWLHARPGLLMTAGDPSAPFEPEQIWFVPYPGGAARKVTNDLSVYSELSVATDGTLAAVRPTGVVNLWVVDARPGAEARRVTSSSTPDASISGYTSTPDGSILFMTVGQRTVHRMGADGSGERVVLPSGSYGGTILGLPGSGIVFSQFGERGGGHLYCVDADGGSPRQLASLPGGEFAMDVSPDGRTVLFRSRAARNELWTVTLDGGKPIRITDKAERPMGRGAFSPDGTRILYSGQQDVGGSLRRVWTVVPAGGGEAVATIDSPPESKDVEWSLDGKSLTFLRSANGATNIYRQRLDGGEPQQVTRFTDGEIFDHERSPDGQLFLVIRRADTDNLWTVAADGSHPFMLTHFDAGQFSDVEWMPPDGRRALFAHGSATSDVVLIKGAMN